MKKLSFIVATLIASQTSMLAEETKNDWSISGNIRAAYISDDGDAYAKEVHDLAVGGSISLTTPKVNGFTATGTVYTSQPLFNQNTNGFLVEGDGSSYSYIGEAYVTGVLFGKTATIIGKKVIDTPFADSDDVGMSPNSFEVYLVQNNDIENVTLLGGRVTKQAGVDAPGNKGEFTDITGGDGASVIAAIYANNEIGLNAQAWHYHLDNLVANVDVSIAYVDGTFAVNENLSISGQYARFAHINGPKDDGTVIGAQADLTFDGASLGLAYNQADGEIHGDNAPLNGFGGGPYYASSDLYTIANAGQDSTAMKIFGGFSATEQISLSAGYTEFSVKEESKGNKNFNEFDLGASYAYSDSLAFDLYVELGTDRAENDFTEYSLFMNYGF